MNKERRKQIDVIIEKMDDLKMHVELLLQEESDSYENMPESFQNGEKGEKSQTAIDALENASSELDECIQYLNEAKEQ